jgi:drug/metabolite transporter (DMT)-like permease
MIAKNVGGRDRQVRAILAVVFAVVGIGAGVGVVPVLGPLGAALCLAAAAGFGFNAVTQRCMGNYVLGVDTCPAPNSEG